LRSINLPTDTLRAFISVIDLGGFTRAAEALGRTQPAISLQMRRLEDIVGAKLITANGRELVLTEPGEALALYARQMLRLNDEAVAHFTGRSATGTLRIGLPTDFSVAYLQEVISDFARALPDLRIEVHCDLSRHVLDRLHADDLDIAVGILTSNHNPYLVRSWEERPLWTAAREGEIHRKSPVPLASHPEGCEYRSRMIAGLRSIGREWRIVYTNPGISGLQRAVSAGLGISALTRKTMLPDMQVLVPAQGFPVLESIRIGLFYKHPRLSDAGLQLVNSLISQMDEAAEPQMTENSSR
jgi:DNA-binding transcriptional LysR family regulator